MITIQAALNVTSVILFGLTFGWLWHIEKYLRENFK